MRKFIRVLASALLAVVAFAEVASAQTVNVQANISWVAPVVNSAGSNAPTSYNVYGSTTPLTVAPATPLVTVQAPTISASVSSTATIVVGSTLYVYVTACNSAGCSALSVPGTKVVAVPIATPGVPTNVTITVVISP